jgi:hypothetical protein
LAPRRRVLHLLRPHALEPGEEIRPASPVNVFGKLAGDPTIFKKVRSGTPVRVERIREA